MEDWHPSVAFRMILSRHDSVCFVLLLCRKSPYAASKLEDCSPERKGRFAFFWFQALAPDLGPHWINLWIDAFLNRPSRENKCASPYIGERLGENSVGGKWLMSALLRIPLTLMGRGIGALGG
jgi:hypothetical protein